MARSRKRKKRASVAPIYVFGIVWAVMALTLPIYRLNVILITLAVSAACAAAAIPVMARLNPRRSTAGSSKEDPEPEPAKSYGAEIDAIIAEGHTAQKEMGRLYASIQDESIRKKINRIMEISDKIVQDAIHDPGDVPQIKRFLSYYLPTTIKLLNAYDRMSSQGVRGENISGSMERIEEMLDAAISAYEKQLDSLFANQALDIETDIQVLNNMIAREGLGEKDFK